MQARLLEQENGNYYSILGLYRDIGKENGNYCSILLLEHRIVTYHTLLLADDSPDHVQSQSAALLVSEPPPLAAGKNAPVARFSLQPDLLTCSAWHVRVGLDYS